MGEADAQVMADVMAGADLRGTYSHGVSLVPGYVESLVTRRIDPRGRPSTANAASAAFVVDGANAMGHVAVAYAVDRAIEAAHEHGVAAASIHHSNHCGPLAHYALQASSARMIGLVTTNGLPTMAPWGGLDRALGMNPIAIAMPSNGPSIVLDIAFAAAARGKIAVYSQKGMPIPEGWAVDEDGNATTDPAAALRGLMLPIGAYKGTGLALVMGLLATALSGASFGRSLGSVDEGAHSGEDGQFVLVLDPAAFDAEGAFQERVDSVIHEMHESRPAPGYDRVRVPGDLELETEYENREHGIPLNDATLEALQLTADRLGVPGIS